MHDYSLSSNKDYSKSVIYLIYCNDQKIRDCYIGSSIDFLTRQRVHKYRSSKGDTTYKTYPLYHFIFYNGGWSNFSTKILEYYPCSSKYELLEKEQYWYGIIKPNLNKYLPRSDRIAYNKKYREVHKDRIKAYKHEYYKRKKLENLQKNCKVIDKSITLHF